MKSRSTNNKTTICKPVQGSKKVAFNPIIQSNFDPKQWLDQFQEKTKICKSQKIRKSQIILKDLREKPKKSKSGVIAELKCFMSLSRNNEKFFMSKFITRRAINKILQNEKSQFDFTIKESQFLKMSDKILTKFSDSESVLKSFELCLKSETYPPTVEFMLVYLGVFLNSINGNYQGAEQYCRNFFDLIVRYKVEEYFIIYLIMQIRLKTNLCEWQKAVNYLSKLISFAWLYNLDDLQIWCYFQFSRAFFFMEKKNKSESFRQKSQMNCIQSKDSIYRELSLSKLKKQIRQIWEGQLQFSYDDVLDQTRLALPPKEKFDAEVFIKDQRKLQSSIKKIIIDCKIKYVPQLLSRISETNQLKAPINTAPFSSRKQRGGNNFLLTHRSRNKNMKTYFRTRQRKARPSQNTYYTIQNSQKNWHILRQMLKNIQAEIDYIVSKK